MGLSGFALCFEVSISLKVNKTPKLIIKNFNSTYEMEISGFALCFEVFAVMLLCTYFCL
jgi:hypothetical protein